MSTQPELPRGLSSLDKVAPDGELQGLADSLGPTSPETGLKDPLPLNAAANAVQPQGDVAAAKGVIEEATTAPSTSAPLAANVPALTSAASTTATSGSSALPESGASTASAIDTHTELPKDTQSGLATGSVADPPKKSDDHVESLISGLAGVAITAPLAGVEKLGGYAGQGLSALKAKADEQGLSGITNSVRDAAQSAANHPSVAPYLQSASNKASELSSKATDTSNYPSTAQVGESAKGAAGTLGTYASEAASAASANVQNLGAKAGLTSAPAAEAAADSKAVPISKEAQQGSTTHDDVLQPGSAEYGAGAQGSTKADSTVA